MRKILITAGILLVAALATKDTIDRFQELDKISASTPAEIEMRHPAQQQPGQRQSDSMLKQKIRFEDNSLQNNRQYNGNSLDNYNRNSGRDYNNIRKNYDRK